MEAVLASFATFATTTTTFLTRCVPSSEKVHLVAYQYRSLQSITS
jgi:hypothetical protein